MDDRKWPTRWRLVCALAAAVVLTATTGLVPARAAEPVLSVEVPGFTGEYRTGHVDEAHTAEDESRRTQRGYIGVYREGVVACNGNPDRFPSPSETIGVGPYTLVGYIWVGPELAASNQTFGSQVGNVAGAGNDHRTNATASGEPTGRAPCPEEDPDAVND